MPIVVNFLLMNMVWCRHSISVASITNKAGFLVLPPECFSTITFYVETDAVVFFFLTWIVLF
jgi:hypothetical protein